MDRICALAGIDHADVPVLSAALAAAGESTPPVIAGLDVRGLALLRPDLLVGDLDRIPVDSLEFLRQLRFVLPNCLIALYSANAQRAWGVAAHLAGANCLLSKAASETELSAGVRGALASGCFTDPRFIA
jgi:DNA-binding NarL/FixJ family response regulator